MYDTPEHRQLQDTLKRFIDNEINPHVEEWEEAEIFPAHEIFGKLGKLGMLGLTRDPEYGGLGLDYSFSMAMAETLGHVHCGAIPMAIGVQTDMCTPALARFGSDALKRAFLAPAIAGEMVGCIGVSEAGAGSDVAAIKTTARKDGGDYIINGSKMWITNSIQADWMCVLANTSDGPPHRNKTLIMLPMKTPGVSVAKKIRKIGMHASDTGMIYFDNVRVPQHYAVGEEGMGFTYQMLQFQEERLWAAANSLQSLQNCIDWTVEWARERKIYGAPLLDNQAVYFKLAELKSELEALRALTYRAGSLFLAGQDVTELASMAKLKAGRLMRIIPDACLQFWGGMGYTAENLVARLYRDGRLASIGAGADEVMLGIIAKQMGILPGKRK
ncbi:acyl-CoA dehydrogenase family protein [Massilia sp. W12]|uniref:acyl-CoA dehydrogenase family protein n=1 Tax=Massilia sp. W12 TaxID=3126507 RepID=UPI0030D3C49D